jgi:hypothetical protein
MATAPGSPANPVAQRPPLAIRVAKSVAAVVAFVATLLGIVFVLWPSLRPEPPPPTRQADLSGLELERPVTFGAYLGRINQPAGGLEDAVLEERGALASFDFAIVGYKERRLPLVWQLIDARNGKVLDQSRDVFIEPEALRDSGSWPVWVPLPNGRKRRVFIQLELYEPRGVVALETLRTRTFRTD